MDRTLTAQLESFDKASAQNKTKATDSKVTTQPNKSVGEKKPE